MQLARPRFAFVLVAILVIASLGAWMASSGDKPQATPKTPPGATEKPDRQAPALLPDQEPSELQPPARTEASATNEAPAKREEVLTKQGAPTLTEGTLQILEPDGSLTLQATGELELMLWSQNGGASMQVHVQSGRWTIPMSDDLPSTAFQDDGAALKPLNKLWIEIDGFTPNFLDPSNKNKPAIPVQFPYRRGLHKTPLLLELQRLRPLVLTVLDARTGISLESVNVRAQKDLYFGSNYWHPSDALPEDRIAERRPSPIEVDPTIQLAGQTQGHCSVGAPGYAWKEIELDFWHATPKTVKLEPGGDLTVHLTPPVTNKEARLRIFADAGAAPLLSAPANRAANFELGGFLPGNVRVAVEIGHWYDSPLVLGETEASITAGVTTDVRVETHAAPELVLAPLAGEVRIPFEWQLGKPQLSLKLLGTALVGRDDRPNPRITRNPSAPAGLEIYNVDFGEVQTGRYVLSLAAFQNSIVLEIGPEGNRGWVFELPPPVEVEVVVTDSSTGEAAPITTLMWVPVRPAEAGGGTFSTAGPANGDGHFRLRVPSGQIQFVTNARAYSTATATVEAFDGLEVQLEVHLAPQAIIKLMDGKGLVPWAGMEPDAVQSLDGPARLASMGGQDGGLWFRVTTPGTYRVRIPTIDGFEPHEPVEVELIDGETVQVNVDLVRIP